jgi:hypothetical protein
MRRSLGLKVLILLLAVLSLGACGGDEEGEEEEGERGEAFATICEMSELTGETGLPSGFPTPDSVTYVKSEETGPSQVVEGYANGSIEDVYKTWHDQFEESDFEITFDEREEHDAEISFEGGGESGQVKLADECGEEDRLYVRITSRPTG